MSATNRAKLIGKLHTALKKHYTQVSVGSRPLLEHILYASLLQDSTYALADEGIAKCEQEFYDWNEVRVTTVTELSQVLSNLPDPVKAASRLKGNLLEIFEEFFTFDIDHLKKENLGKAVAKFEKMSQMTPFVLSYAVQHGLGGHSIPVDYAAMVVMLSTGIVDQAEAAEGRVPGLERAITKTKGAEFGCLLHQCGVDLLMDPKNKTARAVLDATAKGSSTQLDEWLAGKEAAKKRVKRRKTSERAAAKKQAAVDEAEGNEVDTAPTKSKAKSAGKSKPSGPAKPKTAPAIEKTTGKTKTAKKPVATKSADSADEVSEPAKKTASKKSAAKPVAAEKAPAKKPTAKKKSATSDDGAKKKAAKPKATKPKASKASSASSPAKKAKKSASKSDNRRLTKKKPR